MIRLAPNLNLSGHDVFGIKATLALEYDGGSILWGVYLGIRPRQGGGEVTSPPSVKSMGES